MFHVAVCDDDVEIHQLLQSYFTRFSVNSQFTFNVCCFSSGEELLLHRQDHGAHGFHILFLDMEMSGITGLETAHAIRSLPDRDVQVIFLTHYPEYMIDSFNVQPFQYIIKPLSYDLFEEKVMKLCHYIISSPHRFLPIKVKQEQLVLRISNLIALVKVKHTIHQNQVNIFTAEKAAPYTVTGTISEYMDKLNPSSFLLIHRSVIANLEHIRKFTAATVVMSNGTQFSIARSQAKRLKEMYSRHILS